LGIFWEKLGTNLGKFVHENFDNLYIMIMKVKDYMIIKANTKPIYEGTTISLQEIAKTSGRKITKQLAGKKPKKPSK
jgi:hypothetical protein